MKAASSRARFTAASLRILILLTIALPVTASAAYVMASDILPLAVLTIIVVFLLFYTYRLQAENTRLKLELGRYRQKILSYVNSNEAQYETVRPYEMERNMPESVMPAKNGIREEYTKRLYWERLGSTIDRVSSYKQELEKLEGRKKDIEEVIKLTKNKYSRREIDERSMQDILKDHNKQLIEIEAKIQKLTRP